MEIMGESNPNEDESVDQVSNGVEEEGDAAPRRPAGTGARLWDRVRSSLLRQKVNARTVRLGQTCIRCCRGCIGKLQSEKKHVLALSYLFLLMFNTLSH